MKTDNIKILVDSYPTVYDVNTLFFMHDGWLILLFEIGSYISKKTKHCRVSEIKEKFNCLRVYLDFDFDDTGNPIVDDDTAREIYDFVMAIESKSNSVCQGCGETIDTKPSPTYWRIKLCQVCEKAGLLYQK